MAEAGIGEALERARSGDPAALGELFRVFEPDLARLCARLLGSKEEARDAAHEVFLRVRQSLEAYDAKRPFRPWLLAIGARHCIDRLRRRALEKRLFDDAAGDADDHPGAPGPSPLQGLLREESRRELAAALDGLDPRYRAPLVLRYYAEFDYAEIADVIGVTPNQVATLLFRAKRRLRERMSGGGAA
jgi:RNA polymerase sigma-70 factor (ECF subfamily)